LIDYLNSIEKMDNENTKSDDLIREEELTVQSESSKDEQVSATDKQEENSSNESSNNQTVSPDDLVNDLKNDLIKDKRPKLSEEEVSKRIESSTRLKDEGNQHFKKEEFEESLRFYDEALDELKYCDLNDKRSILLNNKAVCKWKLLEKLNPDFKDEKIKAQFDEIVSLLTEAIELNPVYIKPYLKRAELYHKFGEEKLEGSLEDYKKLLQLVSPDDRKLLNEIKYQVCKIEKEIEQRNEKMKEEMFSKLKDLGNLCLRPFGLSTDNFKLQQNENGGYSVEMVNK